MENSVAEIEEIKRKINDANKLVWSRRNFPATDDDRVFFVGMCLKIREEL